MKKWIWLLLFLPSIAGASGIYNPGSGGGGGGTPGGSNGNVQYNNGGSFGGANFFNIYASSSTSSADMLFTSNSIGPILTDAAGCKWRETVATTGSLVTTLLSCPGAATAFRPCTTGMSLGLLASITCP